MSEFHVTIQGKHVLICQSCAARVESPIYDRPRMFTFADAHLKQRVAEGWTCWVSRQRRWYCPGCKPKPGHKMRRVK